MNEASTFRQLACGLAGWAVFACGSVWAQTVLVEAEVIAKSLMTTSEGGLPAKALPGRRAMTRPDPETRLCDRAQMTTLQAETGAAPGLLVKSLYVEEAPSIDLDVLFDFDKATLRPDGAAQLDRLAQALAHPALARQRFVLAGHTDRKGDAQYNDALSCERALAARGYLRDHHQVDTHRLIPMGFGFSRLKDSGDPQSAVNRRAEVRRYSGPLPRQ